MSAPSISSVASSGSSAQAPARPGAPEAASDTSPFAMLLAAIAAADPELQATPGAAQAAPVADRRPPPLPGPQAANDDDADMAIETAADPKTNIVQDPSLDPAAPKSGTKPDKKSNTDKTEADIAAAPLPAQPQPVLPPLPIAPMAQAAVQTQAVANNDDDGDGVSGITAHNAVSAMSPAPSPPALSQPSQAGAKQAARPPQALTAAESTGDSDVLNDLAPTDQAQPARSVDVKFAQVRNPGSGPVSQVAPQPQPWAAVDEDTDGATRSPSNPVPAASPSSQTTTPTAPQLSLEGTAPTPAVPPAAQKADAKPAAKPASDKTADILASGPDNVAGEKPTQNPNFAPSTTADTDNDSKPAHVAASAAPQAQPDTPPPPSQTDALAMPQNVVAINAGDAPIAGNGLTLSVHVTDHTSDSQLAPPSTATPNIDALAISVAARSLGGSKQFDIRLDPPELGRVEVRLSIDASGKTQAHMTADQPQTLELLQKDATNLTRALRDAGLDVSQNGLNFSLKGQGQNSGGQSGNFGNASRGLSLPASPQSIEAAQPINIPYSLLGNARLDIHV